MVLPLRIDHLEHQIPLHAPQHLAVERRCSLLVAAPRHRPERVVHLVGALVVEVDRVELLGIEAEHLLDVLPEGGQIPLVRIHVAPAVGLDGLVDRALTEGEHVLVRVDFLVLLDGDRAFEQLPAQRVDVLALLVHHVVVLEQVLADGEVLRLYLLLRPFDGLGHHAVLDRHALFHAEPVHQPLDAVRPEDAHQVVLERQVEAR